MWAPVKNALGHRNQYYDNMPKVTPGDVVFSYARSKIQAIGVAQKLAYQAPKPESFGNQGSNWADAGWLVEVEFSRLTHPINPKEHLDELRIFMDSKAAPLDQDGNGRERYLMEIGANLAEVLISLSGAATDLLTKELAPILSDDSEYETALEIAARHFEGDLEKIQITKARRGQGYFKLNVRLYEDHCRVTGVSNIRHLRASHIKPWAISNDKEKLDGANGLLLSPHVDHLFDQGFISFEDQGKILVAKNLNPRVLDQWGIAIPANVGAFSDPQRNYLDFHRNNIFEKKVKLETAII